MSDRLRTLSAAEVQLAIDEQRCNGCGLPRKVWGPVCGGMTQGDYTHFHSPEWWWRQKRLRCADD